MNITVHPFDLNEAVLSHDSVTIISVMKESTLQNLGNVTLD